MTPVEQSFPDFLSKVPRVRLADSISKSSALPFTLGPLSLLLSHYTWFCLQRLIAALGDLQSSL